MQLHLTPKILNRYAHVQAQLVDVRIPELGLTLKEGKDLTTRRPYPNKQYLVACRKSGQKAMDGILIITDEPISRFSVITQWSIDAQHIASHEVIYTLLDTDFNCVSDKPKNWRHTSNGRFKDRAPEALKHLTATECTPTMEVLVKGDDSHKKGTLTDHYKTEYLSQRIEEYPVHTIELERLFYLQQTNDRIPRLTDAFLASPSGLDTTR